MHSPLEQFEQFLDDHRSHSGVTLGQGARPEQEHGSNHLVGHGHPDSRGMRAEQVVLKCLCLALADVRGRQRTKSGGDPIDHRLGLDRVFHDLASRTQPLIEAVAWGGS